MVATNLAQPPPGSNTHHNKIHQQIPKASLGLLLGLEEELLLQRLLLLQPPLTHELVVLHLLLGRSNRRQHIGNEGLARQPDRRLGPSNLLFMETAAPFCSGATAYVHSIDGRHTRSPPNTTVDPAAAMRRLHEPQMVDLQPRATITRAGTPCLLYTSPSPRD